MLAIGDIVASKYAPKYPVELLEFVIEKEYIEEVLKNYKIENEIYVDEQDKKFVRKYKLKNGKRLYLHIADCKASLMNMLATNVALGPEIKICSPLVEIALLQILTKCEHIDIDLWEKRIIRYSLLYCYVFPYLSFDAKNKIDDYTNHLDSWAIRNNDVYNSIFEPKQFLLLNHNLILGYIGTGDNMESQYYKLLVHKNVANGMLLFTTWSCYSEDEKIDACMEYIIMNMINEYLVSRLLYNNYIPNEVQLRPYFKRTIMRLSTRTMNKWFTEFMTGFYLDILDRFEPLELISTLSEMKRGHIINAKA